MQKAVAISTEQHFAYGLDTRIPERLFVGKGVVLHLKGWCYAASSELNLLEIRYGGRSLSVANHSWPRADIFTQECPWNDPSGNSLLSGFEVFLPFDTIDVEQDIAVTLHAVLKTGVIVEKKIASVRLMPGYGAVPTPVTWPAQGPRVAICMATYKPPLNLFKAQLASLQAQAHKNWVCIINDDYTEHEHYDRIRYLVKSDPRFIFFQNQTRQNFYLNFQECLSRVPVDADFVALCDQDDVWNPDKLEALLAAFKPLDQLVYSDARVVDETGRVRSETFWNTRRNNYTDLSTLMIANTITGAASMFRASLLADVLPLPVPVGPSFHDHWIGLVALYKGSINYVDRALYDYIQHAEGVIGHNYVKWPGLLTILKQVARVAPNISHMARTVTTLLKQAVEDYTFVQQKVMLARTLMLRNPNAETAKKAVMHRFSMFETSLLAPVQEKFAAVRSHRSTLNLEGMFLWAIIGMRLRNFVFRRKRRDLTRIQTAQPGRRLLDAVISTRAAPRVALPKVAKAEAQPVPYATPVLEAGGMRWIYRNISALTLDKSAAYPRRINLLLATINFDYIFGGYIGMFNLALRLKAEGYRVRIILHEETEWNLREWRQKIQKYPGVTTLFDEVEITSRFDRSIPIEVSPSDRFVATNCWAAHIAHHTAAQLEETRFLFMVQEYEPYFLPMNSISALFQQAYNFPQICLFSTALLQEFFHQNEIGIFARPGGEANACVFSNAIQKFHPTAALLSRQKRRLLFYARPEEHAARNMFELGMIALALLAKDPRVDLTSWSFFGVGSIGEAAVLELAPGVPLELVPKTSLEEYIKLMSTFDVGLSLMLTPHPSLVPLEMAAAGMWTVTNTFANKTVEALQEISTNLIGVEPTVPAIVDGLVTAMSRVDETEQRLAGAELTWPTDWKVAFPDDTVQRMREFLGQP